MESKFLTVTPVRIYENCQLVHRENYNIPWKRAGTVTSGGKVVFKSMIGLKTDLTISPAEIKNETEKNYMVKQN